MHHSPNHPFGSWESVFPDKAMTLAAIDRLVHHAVILEMNVESYRRRAATARQRPRRVPAGDTTGDSDTMAEENATAP